MKIIIIDDDKNFAHRVQKDLQNFFFKLCDDCSFEIITDDFLNLKIESHFDFIFIDIDLITVNGIELATEIKNKAYSSKIIFISNYNNLVYDSLLAQPFFFIRKIEYEKDFRTLLTLIEEYLNHNQLISLKYAGETQMISISNIIYIEAINRELKIYTTDGMYNDSKTLKELYNQLSNHYFAQIHKSFVINLAYLYKFDTVNVVLNGDIQLSIGRTYKENFLKKYEEYLLL